MRVLAIDPGYDRLGIAIIDNASGKEELVFSTCLETKREDDFNDRLLSVGKSFNDQLQKYQPDSVAIETLFFNKNIKTAIGVAEARGVIVYLAKAYGCDVYEFGPQEIKVAVTGYGNSDKEAVFSMLKHLIVGLPEKALDDEYDAIAVGLTCLAQHGRTR